MSYHCDPGSDVDAWPSRVVTAVGPSENRMRMRLPPAQLTLAWGFPMLPVMAAIWMRARVGRCPFQ